jgi:hypothetical protein
MLMLTTKRIRFYALAGALAVGSIAAASPAPAGPVSSVLSFNIGSPTGPLAVIDITANTTLQTGLNGFQGYLVTSATGTIGGMRVTLAATGTAHWYSSALPGFFYNDNLFDPVALSGSGAVNDFDLDGLAFDMPSPIPFPYYSLWGNQGPGADPATVGDDDGCKCGVSGAQNVEDFNFSVPEPAPLALLSLGLTGLGWVRRRKH